MLDDLRFEWRILRKHGGLTVVTCLSRALGIGATAASLHPDGKLFSAPEEVEELRVMRGLPLR